MQVAFLKKFKINFMNQLLDIKVFNLTNLLCPKNWRKLASDDAQGVDGVDPRVRDPRVSVCDHILTISKGVLI